MPERDYLERSNPLLHSQGQDCYNCEFECRRRRGENMHSNSNRHPQGK